MRDERKAGTSVSLFAFFPLVSALENLYACACVRTRIHTYTHKVGAGRNRWVVERDGAELVHQGA